MTAPGTIQVTDVLSGKVYNLGPSILINTAPDLDAVLYGFDIPTGSPTTFNTKVGDPPLNIGPLALIAFNKENQLLAITDAQWQAVLVSPNPAELKIGTVVGGKVPLTFTPLVAGTITLTAGDPQ
jgi:hypothetical protein